MAIDISVWALWSLDEKSLGSPEEDGIRAGRALNQIRCKLYGEVSND